MAARGDATGAYEVLAPWVEEHPEDVEAKSTLAVVAAQNGRLDEAEELLEGLTGDDPRLALLGADIALGRGEARVAILRLAEHRLDHPAVLDREFKRILGQAYVEIGQPGEALEVLGSVEGDPLLAHTRSRALFQSGRMDEAVAELEPFAAQIRGFGLEGAPASQRFLMADILIDYARGLVATGRAEEAVSVLEPNVSSMASRRAWKILAQALVAVGRGGEAGAALSRGQAQTSREPRLPEEEN